MFNPKFTSFRYRIAGLALALWVNAVVVFSGRRVNGAGIVILAVAALVAALIPESPGNKVHPEKYNVT